MKMLKVLIVALPLTFAVTSHSISADNMALPVSEQGQQGIETPRNGQNKAKVESAFGQPLQRIAAVGEPPISKWVYQDFTVYFENDIVLHAVRHRG